MAGALDGVKVLDISRFIAGPYCSMLLADMGADVIKVERKGTGEDSRGMIPFAGEKDGEQVSLYYTQYNKNKRSVTLDFRNRAAQKSDQAVGCTRREFQSRHSG